MIPAVQTALNTIVSRVTTLEHASGAGRIFELFVMTSIARGLREAGYSVGNIDLTIICEAPKIGPHRDAMRARIAELLGVDITAISVKATTTERLGFTGRGEGIAAQAVATVIRE